jgi:hypothetical protein
MRTETFVPELFVGAQLAFYAGEYCSRTLELLGSMGDTE